MKIMILANCPKGIMLFRKELVEALLQKNEVVISVPYEEVIEPLKEIGCKIIDTPVDRRGVNPKKDFALFRTYKKLLKQEKPDLVITYTIKPNIYGSMAARILHIPYACNITGLGTAFEKGGMLQKIVTLMYKVSLKKAKRVFFENEGDRMLFVEKRIVKESLTKRLSGAGVNLERFQVKEYPSTNENNFLFMGRIMAEKGIDELFDAMRILNQKGIVAHLDALGYYEDDYKEKIEKAEKEGWLTYHGFQTNVVPFIESCSCFVLPSWHEGMANTNLESAAMGRPVITTDIFGCKEAVVEGVSGYLCKRQDTASLVQAMEQFCSLKNEQKRTMGLEGRHHMEEVFDKKKVIHETLIGLGVEE